MTLAVDVTMGGGRGTECMPIDDESEDTWTRDLSRLGALGLAPDIKKGCGRGVDCSSTDDASEDMSSRRGKTAVMDDLSMEV